MFNNTIRGGFIAIILLIGSTYHTTAIAIPPGAEGETCEDVFYTAACWLPVQNIKSCWIWNPYPRENKTYTWSAKCKNGLPHGRGKQVWAWTTKDGQNAIHNMEGVNLKGKHQGQWEVPFADGRSYTETYVDGIRHGRIEGKDENGKVTSNGYYSNGKMHGQWEYWDNGNNRMTTYVDGIKHGPYRILSSTGNSKSGQYVNGKEHGEQVLVWEEGVSTSYYINGVQQE